MRFLVDMNLSPSWVQFFADNGFAAVHWSTIGSNQASDQELMHWAAGQDHIVLTCDLDFPALLAATRRRRPSVILVRSDILTPARIGSALLVAIGRAEHELGQGAILSFDVLRARLRILPLGDAEEA
jgi:predicted nuclease of predicted toxin-antitoxin system